MTEDQLAALAGYLEARDRARADAVSRTLATLNPRELSLVREAAVMGYVRGVMAGRVGRTDIPQDSATLFEVIDACLSMPDLYPTINSLLADAANT